MLKERYERLKNVATMPLSKEFPLLTESKISPLHYNNIHNAVNVYIWSSLVAAYPDKSFTLSPHLLYAYEDEICNLPNITPNGLILPKRENFLTYHEVHQSIVKLMDSYGISDKIASIHNPINIRLVRGNKEGANRPKASTKLHTDIWAGEFANSIMVFIPVLGDIANIGVEFYEPPNDFYPDFVKILNDYNEGAHFIRTSKKYECRLKNKHIYFIDPFLLHKTYKNSEHWRLSIDFRFLPKEEVVSDLKIDTNRNENYISYEEWQEMGRTRLLFTNTPVDKIDPVKDKNAYAASYETITL